MNDKIESIQRGTIGWFWTGYKRLPSLKRSPDQGYVRLGNDNRIHLTLLNETDIKSLAENVTDPEIPRIVLGATEHGGLILLDLRGYRSELRYGGSSASVMHYYGQSIVAGVNLRKIRSNRLKSISAHFFGTSHWFDVRPVDEKLSLHPNSNLIKSYSISVDHDPGQTETISEGREIVIARTWLTTGPADRRTVHAPISISCRSRSPKDLFHLRRPLLYIQDLISLAYGGLVVADGGRAEPDSIEEHSSMPRFWDGLLMSATPNAALAKDTGFPLFHCSDIGGLSGLRRWIKLYDSHARAVHPVVGHYRTGHVFPPLRLLEVASGIEYWVAIHRRSTKWAHTICSKCKKGNRLCGYAWTLASHVGQDFGDWVGDPHRWACEFWSTYNRLKHEPSYSIDPYEVSLLAESGSLLLAAALLNRISRSKTPSKLIFTRGRYWALRGELREMLKLR